MKKLYVVLPAFNESQVIREVLLDLKKELVKISSYQCQIVVIDDGSTDETALKAKKAGVVVLRHLLNRGLGGALGTGLAYAKRRGADILITMDSDGQHDPADISRIIQPILQKKTDIVIGSRMLKQKEMPLDRLFISWMGSIVTFLLFRVWTSDSQSGFRAFNRKAIDLIEIKTREMEVSSEIFGEIKQKNLRFIEKPIQVIYTGYSRHKGQSNLNSLRVVLKLILRLFR